MVVAGQREHAAVGRRAGVVGMLEDVHRAVDARPLAVPDGEDALVLGTGEEPDLLRAPERGGRRILVDAGLEVHAVLLQERLRLPQRPVEIAERRAPVARDHAGRVEPGRLVPQVLDHRQPDQRLGAGHVDVPRRGGVLVVESDRGERHRYSCPQRPATSWGEAASGGPPVRGRAAIIPHGTASARRGGVQWDVPSDFL